MRPTKGEDVPPLASGAAEVLQAATRVLAGAALRSLDALDSAVTLPQFRLLAVLAGGSRPGTRPSSCKETPRCGAHGWQTLTAPLGVLAKTA